jgi:hypothetical protein
MDVSGSELDSTRTNTAQFQGSILQHICIRETIAERVTTVILI